MSATLPKVVILGGGFGGVAVARGLRGAAVETTLVDRTNHHLFQPLLYQVATATLAPSDISMPIRSMLRRVENATVLLADVESIDPERRTVRLRRGADLPYDYLVVATGARHSYFGHDDWAQFAPGLKSLDDALEIRRRFLLAFERAERATDAAERAEWLTFCIIGGGATGVELAGMLPEVAKNVRRDFRHIDTSTARVVLIEGGPRLLPSFPPALSERAKLDLEKLGVEVRLGESVTKLDQDGVMIGDRRITAREVFWAAGNAASPLTRDLGAPLDRAGRVLVAPDLSVPAHPEIFVVGDAAAALQKDGTVVPGVAPAANQMGAAVVRNIRHSLAGRPREPFTYFSKGNLATVGRHKAVAKLGPLQMSGYFAWFTWLFVHILYLAGFRNRIAVLLQWGYAYLTFQRGDRLITGRDTDEFPVPILPRS
jgi:NADH dehydrogenase